MYAQLADNQTMTALSPECLSLAMPIDSEPHTFSKKLLLRSSRPEQASSNLDIVLGGEQYSPGSGPDERRGEITSPVSRGAVRSERVCVSASVCVSGRRMRVWVLRHTGAERSCGGLLCRSHLKDQFTSP